MNFKIGLIFTFWIMFLSGCAHTSSGSGKWQLTDTVQTKELAEFRASAISDISYFLNLDLSQNDKRYYGQQEIQFKLKAVVGDLPLEFSGGEIQELTVNNTQIQVKRGPLFVRLPSQHLHVGNNIVKIRFSQAYSNSGAGFHRFKDPQDNRDYLYTNFEPFDANQWAPFFDQPDLKAPLKLSVITPANWATISGGTIDVEQESEGTRFWSFHATPPISTYLYALVTGEYESYQDQYKSIPIRLFVRKSLAKFVDQKEWLKVTKQGLEFYENFYGIPYPFHKYDQLIVPEFNAGAMENVGAVTFSERYIRRGVYTRNDRVKLSSVILHEMAHQWFGNLVTMKWWSDLWLNESFATFMAALAQSQATEYKEAWVEFRDDKVSAYWQDELATTHPVSGTVKNSNEAFTSFDDITYGKGAAVLKQLYNYVGEEKFRKAISIYFGSHSYKNADLADFIAAFEQATDSNLKPWFSTWLETTGVNTFDFTYSCKVQKEPANATKDSSTTQTETTNEVLTASPTSPTSRPQSFEVGYFNLVGDKLRLFKKSRVKFTYAKNSRKTNLEVDSEGTEKIPGCADFAYPNFGDHAYAHFNLDAQSLEFIKKHVDKVEDPLLKIMIWQDFWRLVVTKKMTLNEFSDLALRALRTETDQGILIFLGYKTVGYKWGEFDSVYHYWPKESNDEKTTFAGLAGQYEKVLEERYNKATAKTDLKYLFYDLYMSSVRSEHGLSRVAELYPQVKESDRRWRALHVLCASGFAKAHEWAQTEAQQEKSDLAKKNELICEALNPDAGNKKKWVTELTSAQTKLSADENDLVAKALFKSKDRALIADSIEQIYGAIEKSWPLRKEVYQFDLARGLAPIYCENQSNKRIWQFLKSKGDMISTLRVPLLERADEDRICVSVKEFNRHAPGKVAPQADLKEIN